MRAKFELTQKTETLEGGEVKFQPVVDGSPENESFFKWTPYGEISIGTINKTVLEQMTVGKQYYVDFTEAE